MKAIAWILSLAALGTQLYQNFEACDQSKNMVVHDFAATILKSMPKNAVIFTKGDLPSNSIRYLSLCENYRPDVVVFDIEMMSYRWALPMLAKFYPKLVFPGDYWHLETRKNYDGLSSFNLEHFFNINYNLHPMYFCEGLPDRDPSWSPRYHTVPFGVCDKIEKTHAAEFNTTMWYEATKNVAKRWSYPHDAAFPATSWERIANSDMWHGKISMALHMFNLAEKVADEEEKLELYLYSYKLYKGAIKSSATGHPTYWHKNFALVCEKLLRYENMHKLKTPNLVRQSLDHFQLYLEKDKGADPQTAAIKQMLSYLRKQHHHLESKETCSGEEGSKKP